MTMNPPQQGAQVTHQGGATTQQRFTLSEAVLAELRLARHRDQTNGDGYLSVMLAGNAGWSAEQIAGFLGIRPEDADNWIQEFQSANYDVNRLRHLTPPRERV